MGRCVLVHATNWRRLHRRIRALGRDRRLLGALVCMAVCGCQGPQQPESPGGGPEVILDYGTFVAEIEPILQQRGCSNSACHGDQGSGELLLSGGDAPEADFLAVRGHVTPRDPAQSPLLLKPLAEAAGGLVHGGGDIFLSTDDHDYEVMMRWVVSGSLP